MKRFVNKTRHLCGCVTKFDTIDWRSVITTACTEHAKYAEDVHREER